MARNSSFADFIADWRRLLAALDANPDSVPDLSTQRPAMESILDELEAVVTRQDAIRVDSKENASEARQLLQKGSDVAIQIRAALRAHFGPRNPKLAEFRVRVLGQPRRRPNPEEPVEGEKPAA